MYCPFYQIKNTKTLPTIYKNSEGVNLNIPHFIRHAKTLCMLILNFASRHSEDFSYQNSG